jgi:hypothetical protein
MRNRHCKYLASFSATFISYHIPHPSATPYTKKSFPSRRQFAAFAANNKRARSACWTKGGLKRNTINDASPILSMLQQENYREQSVVDKKKKKEYNKNSPMAPRTNHLIEEAYR